MPSEIGEREVRAAGKAAGFGDVKVVSFSDTPTRLKALSSEHQERIINWGYSVSDAAIRRHVFTDAPAPKGLPYDRSP